MKFLEFLTEQKVKKQRVIVVYGGGFQPFHQGHMSSYLQAKQKFPKADFFVASSTDIKKRPIPFEDKRFLAQQAGVVDNFVLVSQPLNPKEILKDFDPDRDILIIVRSERDPVNYTKKGGGLGYYQPFKSIKECKPFAEHGYVFVTKKKTFKIGSEEVYSGSQIRNMYSSSDDDGKIQIINDLYPNARQKSKVKKLLDKYIGTIKEDLNEEFEELITEGVHDKGIFKAVFLGGGPGSGKDYVMDMTLSGHGLVEINSDKAFEYLMDKNNLNFKMPESERERRDVVRAKAKTMTEIREKLAIFGRNGLIINGTADDPEKIKKIKDKLEELGYETQMIMVNTRDEISQQRNIERGQRGGRTVDEKLRSEKWKKSQSVRPLYAEMFGDAYTEFDNSEDLRVVPQDVKEKKEKEMLDIFKKMKKFVDKPPKNEEAKNWISSEFQSRDKEKVDTSKEYTPHPESKSAEEAKKLGLEYYGFGRYGKSGKVTHRSVNDKLVVVDAVLKKPNVPSSSTGSSGSVNRPKTIPPKTLGKIKSTYEKSKKKLPEGLDSEFEQMLSEDYSLSDSSALNLLLLGTRIDEIEVVVGEEKKESPYLKDKTGNIRTFMLRSTAATEARYVDGYVEPFKNGYVIRLSKENKNVRIFKEDSGNETTGTGSSSSSARDTSYSTRNTSSSTSTYRRTEGDGSSRDQTRNKEISILKEDYSETSTETQSSTKKITIAEIRARKTKKIIDESIDKGIEPGIALNSFSRDDKQKEVKTLSLKKFKEKKNENS